MATEEHKDDISPDATNAIPDLSSTQESQTQPLRGIDPRSVLLPNKEIHSLDSAQRTNAGELYQKEQSASIPLQKAPPLPPVEKKFDDTVAPLETYQSDIQKYIRDKNVSSITVAAAEADRNARVLREAPKAPEASPEKSGTSRALQVGAIIAGSIIMLTAIGVFGYGLYASRSLPHAPTPTAPFIAVDASADVPFTADATRDSIMQTLNNTKSAVTLSLGLIGQLRPVLSTSTGQIPLTAQSFMSAFAPNMPPQLLRSLQPQFLLAVHSYDTNQPLLMLSVDSYEDGYAGMLAWEKTMGQDLLPLFAYTPSPHSNLAPVGAPPPQQVIQTGFVDTIVDNHDARAITNSYGDISLVWLFVDNGTILITTNPNTVHEVVTRLTGTPRVSLPPPPAAQ
jgi:hypothetical protein